MGYYLQTEHHVFKAAELLKKHGAVVVEGVTPHTWDILPTGKSLVCVIENGPFDAAGWAFSKEEVAAFLHPDSGRQRKRTWLIMDRTKVMELIGLKECFPDWK